MRLTLIALLLAGVVGCDEGEGLTKEEEKAEREMAAWLAAPDGDPQSHFEMGVKYRFGKGVPQDDAEAAKWFRMAAELGHADAQHSLACHHYLAGTGVRDDAFAAKWYRKAAEQGHAKAQCCLGDVYRGRGRPAPRGKGVAKDYAEAVKWYRKAAEQGDAQGQSSLGLMYRDGEGVPHDYVEAYAWLSVGGQEKWALRRVKAELTPEQLIAAEKRAAELTEQINANKAK